MNRPFAPLSRLVRRAAAAWFALLLVAVPVARASSPWPPPSAPQLARLERALASQHAQYDPAERMLRRPFSTPGYHTALKGGFVHPTRDSLGYALGLLDTGKPDHLDRAAGILRRVVALQDADPASPTHGVWSWFLEEPLAQMRPPDFNWADFNGTTLLAVARDHRDRLPADLAAAIDAAILRACAAIKKRNVGPHYTNIAIMGAYVTLFAGELLDAPEYRDYGLARLERFHRYTAENGSFEEYNSPTYTVVALQELARLDAHVRTAAARPLIADLLRRAWTEIATHYHAPTRQWAGPHSRAYRSLTGDSLSALIQRGTAGRVDFGVDLPDREELRLPLACPPDLVPAFGPLASPRTVVQTFIKRTGIVGTTYLHPDYALGSINRGDLWNQRRPLILHYGTAAAPGYLRLRVLKNGYDYSSAILHAAQHEGRIAGLVNFVTDGGDTHISLDRVKAATIRARDLRLRFEVGGPAASTARLEAIPGGGRFRLGPLDVAVAVPHARFGSAAPVATLGRDEEKNVCLDVVFHAGEERAIDFSALPEAAVAFALSVLPSAAPLPPAARIETADGVLRVVHADLAVSAPLKPSRR